MKANLLCELQRRHEESGLGDDAPGAWETVCPVWLEMQPQSGTEFEQAEQVIGLVVSKAKSQYLAAAHSGMRLQRGDRIWHVRAVYNDREHNRFSVWELVEEPDGH